MIAEGLKYLSDQAKASIPLIAIESNDPYERTFVSHDGRIIRVAVLNRPRSHTVETADDLIALANRFKAEGESPVVWYSDTWIVLVIDDAEKRTGFVRLELIESAVWESIVKLETTKQRYKQKEFIRLLRIDLAGATGTVDLVSAVRNVKWENSDTQTGKVMRGNESMSREITSKIAEAHQPPEFVTLTTTVYLTPGFRTEFHINCALEINPEDQTFQLIPLPDEIDRVRQQALSFVGGWLAAGLDKEIPCYQGTP